MEAKSNSNTSSPAQTSENEEPNSQPQPAPEDVSISVAEVEADPAWLASMEERIKITPKLLDKSAGRSSCCIFRVPQSLVEINKKAYQPHIVSIGPFHNGLPHLAMIQEHKWRLLGSLLSRTLPHGVTLNSLYKAIAPLEDKIRDCYSETIDFDSKSLVEMMVLDGCFIIEVVCIVGGLVFPDLDDPIFNLTWIFSFLIRDCFLDIKFSNGVLEIPTLTLDDFTSSVFLNFVAFEQCYNHCSKHITTYVTFMGCLINTPVDAGYLCDRKVVENYFGTDEEIARFFNNLGKEVAFDIQRTYLAKQFRDVNEYYRNNWHVRWAGFKHTYFDTPWSCISAFAAVLLLILTMIQAFFSVYAYTTPAKPPR